MKKTPAKNVRTVALVGYLLAAVLLSFVLAETALGGGRPIGIGAVRSAP